jgi:hypothetical protein
MSDYRQNLCFLDVVPENVRIMSHRLVDHLVDREIVGARRPYPGQPDFVDTKQARTPTSTR